MEFNQDRNSQAQMIPPLMNPMNASQFLSRNLMSVPQNSAKPFEDFNQFNQHFNSELQPRNNEVASQYRLRKAVYQNVMEDLKDHEKAICFSNIWSNKITMAVKYPKKVEELIAKYAPKIE